MRRDPSGRGMAPRIFARRVSGLGEHRTDVECAVRPQRRDARARIVFGDRDVPHVADLTEVAGAREKAQPHEFLLRGELMVGSHAEDEAPVPSVLADDQEARVTGGLRKLSHGRCEMLETLTQAVPVRRALILEVVEDLVHGPTRCDVARVEGLPVHDELIDIAGELSAQVTLGHLAKLVAEVEPGVGSAREGRLHGDHAEAGGHHDQPERDSQPASQPRTARPPPHALPTPHCCLRGHWAQQNDAWTIEQRRSSTAVTIEPFCACSLQTTVTL